MTPILTFLGIALLCLYTIASNKLEVLLSPKLYWTVYFIGTAMGIFIFSLGNTDRGFKTFKIREIFLSLLYVYPVVIFVLLNPTELKNINKPVIKEIGYNVLSKQKHINSLPVDKDGYINLNLFELWLLVKNYPYLLKEYKFKTSGRVERVYGNALALRRSFITCCIADATPVEIEIQGVTGPKEGDWIEVSGRVLLKNHVIILVESYTFIEPKGFISVWSESPPFNP